MGLWIRHICEILGLLSGIRTDHVRYPPQFGNNVLAPSSERMSGLIWLRKRFNNGNAPWRYITNTKWFDQIRDQSFSNYVLLHEDSFYFVRLSVSYFRAQRRNLCILCPAVSHCHYNRDLYCSILNRFNLLHVSLLFVINVTIPWGQAGVQLVEALLYKPEGRGFDSQWRSWHNPSGRTMALGSTQPLTEMSTRNISWWVKAAAA